MSGEVEGEVARRRQEAVRVCMNKQDRAGVSHSVKGTICMCVRRELQRRTRSVNARPGGGRKGMFTVQGRFADSIEGECMNFAFIIRVQCSVGQEADVCQCQC